MTTNSIALPAGATLAASFLVLPLYLSFEPISFKLFTAVSTSSIFIQGFLATAIAGLLYVKIINLEGPVFLSLINFIIPLIAYFSGAFLLNERIELNVLIALGTILLALYLNYDNTIKFR